MGGRFKKLRPVEYGSLQPGDGQLMSARARHGMLIGVAVILSTIAPSQTFAEFENTEWSVHDLYKQCNNKGGVDEVFCLEFVSSVARQAFMNGLALKHIKDLPDLMTMSIPSAHKQE